MRSLTLSTLVAVTLVAPSPAWSQSITTDGSIETDAQLVSKVATGTAPLAVSSTTRVPNLNADELDGMDSASFAQESDLTSVEMMLIALQAQVDALGLALVQRTGQTTCYDAAGGVIACATGIGPGQDGQTQLGVAWPNPRFTKNGNGTVTDNLTGLIWLENADCAAAQMNWTDALAFANTLFDGSVAHNSGDCGLSDSSGVGAWRLPSRFELESLLHLEFASPPIPNTAGTGQWVEGDPFSSIQPSAAYWTSTTSAIFTSSAWTVSSSNGGVGHNGKGNNGRVWPVRGGQ